MSRDEDIVVCLVCLGMETFTRLWRHAFQIITRLFQQFVVHVLGCLDHASGLFDE